VHPLQNPVPLATNEPITAQIEELTAEISVYRFNRKTS
jgi:hypothetical protein